MLELAEILATQTVERGTVHLRRAADGVVDARLERVVTVVVAVLARHVPVVDENGLAVPVQGLAWQPIAPLEDQDPLTRWGQVAGQGPSPRTAADDDDIVPAVTRHHAPSFPSAPAAAMAGTSSSHWI